MADRMAMVGAALTGTAVPAPLVEPPTVTERARQLYAHADGLRRELFELAPRVEAGPVGEPVPDRQPEMRAAASAKESTVPGLLEAAQEALDECRRLANAIARAVG